MFKLYLYMIMRISDLVPIKILPVSDLWTRLAAFRKMGNNDSFFCPLICQILHN